MNQNQPVSALFPVKGFKVSISISLEITSEVLISTNTKSLEEDHGLHSTLLLFPPFSTEVFTLSHKSKSKLHSEPDSDCPYMTVTLELFQLSQPVTKHSYGLSISESNFRFDFFFMKDLVFSSHLTLQILAKTHKHFSISSLNT